MAVDTSGMMAPGVHAGLAHTMPVISNKKSSSSPGIGGGVALNVHKAMMALATNDTSSTSWGSTKLRDFCNARFKMQLLMEMSKCALDSEWSPKKRSPKDSPPRSSLFPPPRPPKRKSPVWRCTSMCRGSPRGSSSSSTKSSSAPLEGHHHNSSSYPLFSSLGSWSAQCWEDENTRMNVSEHRADSSGGPTFAESAASTMLQRHTDAITIDIVNLHRSSSSSRDALLHHLSLRKERIFPTIVLNVLMAVFLVVAIFRIITLEGTLSLW